MSATFGVNVKDYGARGDDTTDDAPAIQAAIDAISDPLKGDYVFLPFGVYRVSKPLQIDRPVVLQGAGGSEWFPATTIKADKGVTALKIRNAKEYTSNPKHGDYAVLRDFQVLANGRDQSWTTGSRAVGSTTLTVASSSGFREGQVIGIVGAGPRRYAGVDPQHSAAGVPPKNRLNVTASIDIDLKKDPMSPRLVTLSSPFPTIRSLLGAVANVGYAVPGKGCVIDVVNAGFPQGTHVTSIVTNMSGASLTMSADATASVVDAAVIYHDDLFATIQKIAGTTITIDNVTGVAVSNAVIYHADAGIYCASRCRISNVSVGDEHHGFQGNGVHLYGYDHPTPGGNCNGWMIDNCVFTYNLHGIYVTGNSANAGTALLCDVQHNRWFGLNDNSALGNTYVSLHVAGGYGYKTTVDSVAQNTLLGCYTEGGTYNTFANGTLVIGGLMSPKEGTSGVLNVGGIAQLDYVQFGLVTAVNTVHDGVKPVGSGYSDYQQTYFPGGFKDTSSLYSIIPDASASGWPNAQTQFFKKTRKVDGAVGWWGYECGSASQGFPYLWSDSDVAVGMGHMWMPRGFHIGTKSSGGLSESESRYFTIADPADAPGPSSAGTRGDCVFNRTPSVQGPPGSQYVETGWICTDVGWVVMRSLTGT